MPKDSPKSVPLRVTNTTQMFGFKEQYRAVVPSYLLLLQKASQQAHMIRGTLYIHYISYPPCWYSSSYSSAATNRWAPITGLLFPLTGEDCILVTGCGGLCDICCVVLRKKPGGIVLRVVSVHLPCGPTLVQLWRLLKKFSLGTGQRWDELFWQGWFGPIFSARSLMCVFLLKAFNPVSLLTTTQYFSLFQELI